MRLGRLQPDSPRPWGTLTPNEMLCHLADSFRTMLGLRQASPLPSTRLRRTATRLIALHTPLPWPHGIPTRPEVNPKQLGTKPASFDADRVAVIDLMQRFVAPDAAYHDHPIFGALTRDEWLVWGHRHMDHHLRQFGI